MNLDQALQTFVVEARELLDDMESALLRLENDPGDEEQVHALFRAAHTIKGSAGLFGLDAIVGFTHVVENLLDRLRNRELAISGELIAVLLPCGDHIARLVDCIPVAPEATLQADGERLLARLREFLAESPLPATRPASGVAAGAALAPADGGAAAGDNWHLSLRFDADVLRNGLDPLSFIRYLSSVGRVVAITTLADAMPEAAAMDPESCYLGFEIELQSSASREAIESVFEFVRDDASIVLLPPHSQVSAYIELIQRLPEGDLRLGEILVESGALTRRELDAGLARQAALQAALPDGEPATPLGAMLTEQPGIAPQVVKSALDKQARSREHKLAESKLLRVPATKLDQLINLVGELVIAGAGASLLAARQRDGALHEANAVVSRLVEEIRDGVLRLRMVQIGDTFGRFQRVVHDVGRELGKEIELVIRGADTELDKSVVEGIADPLTHLVRNAIDHGIEPAEQRSARGKPVRGTLRLEAYHDSGSIVIEVADDGGGLDPERILAKARSRGLVAPGQTLSPAEINDLIFAPGFSTAEAVSELSGRGVGMDVVRQNIEALRGTVELASTPGEGTLVRLRLPLTLAIIDGFLVEVAGAAYVLPLDTVLECVELSAADRERIAQRPYLDLRGELLPVLRLREHFDLPAPEVAPRRENIVVVRAGGQQAGLVVDRLLGEFQTVIKPLGKVFSQLRGIGGSTILGSGQVALILDVPALLHDAAAREGAAGGRSKPPAARLAAAL